MSNENRRTWGRRWDRRGKKGPQSQRRGERGRRRLELDALEDRTLLDGSAHLLNLGDHYFVEGQSIGILRATDQILVQLQDGTDLETLDRLTAAGGPAAGATRLPTSNPDLWILSLAEAAADLGALEHVQSTVAADPGVSFAAQTFFEPTSQGRMWATNEVTVALKAGVSPDDFFVGPTFTGYRRLKGTTDQFVATTTAAAGVETVQLANQLRDDARTQWVSADFYVQPVYFAQPNDTLLGTQWHLNNTGQFGGKPGADARLFGAWDLGFTGQGVVVGIMDSGVDIDHPDLAAHIFVNQGEIAGNGVDDDGNGYIDDVNGWNFGTNSNNPRSNAEPHGTAVAGVAAGVGNNGLGVAGAGYNATILPATLGDVPLSGSRLAEAVYYASGRNASGVGTWGNGGAAVVTHSYGVPPDAASTTAFDWSAANGRGGLGTVNVAASGNGAGSVPAGFIGYPASLNSTLAIGASTDSDVRSSYSQYGLALDIVAPSNGGLRGITTTDVSGASGYDPGNYTNTFGGTSSATPLVAGVVSLLLEANPSLTFAQVRQALRDSAEKIGTLPYDASGRNLEYGSGRIDAREALLRLSNLRLDLALPTDLAENQTYTNRVMGKVTFTGATPPGAIQEYSATVDLGNGQAPVPANLVTRSDGTVDVVVPTIFYREGGTYQITIRLSRLGAVVAMQSGSMQVADLPITVAALPLSASEGIAYNGVLATFIDTDPDTIMAGLYTVVVDWGDGTTSPGVVSALGGNTFQVSGQHVYNGGDYVMTVTVTGPGKGKASDTAPVTVSNSVLTVTPRTVTAIEGRAFSGTIASFVDSDPRVIPSTYYKASIDWNDGPYKSEEVDKPIPDFISEDNPLISNLRLNVGQFKIADLDVNLTIRHDRPGDLTVFLIGPDGTRVQLFSGLTERGADLVDTTFDDEAATAIAAGTPAYTGSFRPSQSLSAFDGKILSGTWQLEMTDTQPGFIGTLESWSLSAKELGTLVSDPSGGFTIKGDHIFQVGTYQVAVRVQDGDISDETVFSTVVVENAAITTSPAKVNVIEGATFNGLVAYFFDSNVNARADAFTATIDWGDGTTTDGLVTADGGGQFVVTGQHGYAAPGQYQMLVTLHEMDAQGNPVTPETSQEVTVTVINANLTPESTTFTAVEGEALSDVAVALFRDGNVLADPADYTVNVDWGNGEAAPGTVRAVAGEPGLFEVVSNYAYPRAGNFSATVRVVDNAGVMLTMVSRATITDAPLVETTPQGWTILGTERTDTGPTVLGTFRDDSPFVSNASLFRANVDWGDGTTSTAQVVATGGGNYQVVGSHSFPSSGSFLVQIDVTSVDGSSLLLRTGAFMNDLILPLSGKLEPGSDTGTSNSDGVTSAQTLTFAGRGDQSSIITLYAEPAGGGARRVLGQTNSDAQGNWRLTVGPMAAGSYRILGQATDNAGRPGSALTVFYGSSNPLVVDTVGPAVLSTRYDSRQRAFRITYQDTFSGLAGGGILNAANYVLNTSSGQVVAAASVSGVGGNPNTVLVRFRSIPRGRSVLMINTLGVTDLAGNGLGKNQPNAVIVNLPPGVPYYSAYELNNGSTTVVRANGRQPAGPREFVAWGIWRNRRPPLRG